MVLRGHLLFGACLLLLGCIGKTQPVRMDVTTPIVVAFSFYVPAQKSEYPVPESVQADVVAALQTRNFAPEVLAPTAVDFQRLRDTSTRLEAVNELAGGKHVLLVELSVEYYSQLQGRVKWNVYAKTSFVVPGAAVSTVQVDYPAMLYLPHEGAREAVVSVSDLIATAIGAQLDEVLSGRGAVTADAQMSPELLYFVMVDRFKNGDPANDVSVNPTDAQGWHGGDLQGVTDELANLRDMGVTRLWLSPILQSRTDSFMGHGAFHGYWVDDFLQIDPRFGGAPALVTLRDMAAKHAMGLVFDMVVNHTAFDSPLRQQHPNWFHGKGAITDWNDPQQLTTHDVHGLPDLVVERADVFAYLLASAQLLNDLGKPAGFRLDAVKHVPTSFWERYVSELEKMSPQAFTLGEVFEGRPQQVATMQHDGGFSRAFDFPLAFALRDVFCGDAPAAALGAVLSLDHVYEEPHALVTFLDNHDMSRIASVCKGDAARVTAALEALLTLRGVPSLTYGTESMLLGEKEPENRADMRFDARPLAPVIGSLMRLRARHPVLSRGTSVVVDAREDAITLLRDDGDTQALWTLGATPDPKTIAHCSWQPALEGRVSVWTTTACPAAQELGARFAKASRTVRFLLPEKNLRVVGSATELGAWEPSRAPEDATVTLHAGTVLAYKLVRLREGGVEWEASANRYLFVAPGHEPLTVELAWRAS